MHALQFAVLQSAAGGRASVRLATISYERAKSDTIAPYRSRHYTHLLFGTALWCYSWTTLTGHLEFRTVDYLTFGKNKNCQGRQGRSSCVCALFLWANYLDKEWRWLQGLFVLIWTELTTDTCIRRHTYTRKKKHRHTYVQFNGLHIEHTTSSFWTIFWLLTS